MANQGTGQGLENANYLEERERTPEWSLKAQRKENMGICRSEPE